MPLSVAVAVVIALVLLFSFFYWSARRYRGPLLNFEHSLPIEELTRSLAGVTLGTTVEGNAVEVLENGDFFDVLLGHIAEARHSVHFETFLWKQGVLGKRLANTLAERARAGVAVRVLLDAVGAKDMGEDTSRHLREAGCHVVFFNPPKLRNLGVYNDRDHRKLVVIDGRQVFVGGHCIVDDWLGNAEDGKHVADVSVRLQGPIVNNMQSAFSENWTGVTGELLIDSELFPTLASEGEVTMHAAFVKPEGSAPAVKIVHHAALCLARLRIRIQNPYFIPDKEAIAALREAVSRGVDVRVLMPSAEASDNAMVQHAGHRNFEELLRSGVRLFEYPHTLLHQKIMTIDDQWSAIGSSNFDDRSFETNDEITLAITDPNLNQRLNGIFERYAARANEVTLEAWQRRGLWHRLKDHACYQFNELL